MGRTNHPPRSVASSLSLAPADARIPAAELARLRGMEAALCSAIDLLDGDGHNDETMNPLRAALRGELPELERCDCPAQHYRENCPHECHADDESIVRDAELRRLWTIESKALALMATCGRRRSDILNRVIPCGFTAASNQAAIDLDAALQQEEA